MSDYQRWRYETEAATAIEPPKAPIPTVQSDVVVPTMQSLAIGAVIAGAGSGLLWLCGAPWAAAWRWGLGLGLGTFTVAEIGFILQHRAIYISPVRLAFERLRALRPPPPEPPKDEEPWRVIRPHSAQSKAIEPDLVHESTAAAVGPQARLEIEEIYQFVTALWPTGNVSRENAARLGFGRACWERLVGGRRGRGGESARGLLDRAGVVRKTPAGWAIAAPMGAALCWNDELRAYSKARRALVRDGRDRTGSDKTGVNHRARDGPVGERSNGPADGQPGRPG